MASLNQIRESIEVRLDELRSEMTSLQAARAALHTNGAARARSGAAAGAVTTPKRRRRRAQSSVSRESATDVAAGAPAAAAAGAPAAATSAPSAQPAATSSKPRPRTGSRPAGSTKPVEVLLAGKLEAMLGDAPDGLNAVAIATQANARDTQVRALLRELEGAGQVRRSGVGRGSRWRLVTDEERIAERAAELEALRKPHR